MVIVWTENALLSLEVVASYVETFFGRQKARQTVRDIRLAVRPIKDFPNMGMVVAMRANGTPIRRIIHKQSLIYYHVANNVALIDLVWDGRRNPEYLEDILYKI